MESWVEEARAEAGACPSCGASQAMPIVYGMPVSDDYWRLQGQVVFAGCCIPAAPTAYACGVCKAEWGQIPAPEFTEPEASPFDDLD